MNAIQTLRQTLDLSDMMLMKDLHEFNDAPLTFPTDGGGCHPLWVMGHLAYVECELRQIMFGGENALAHWKSIFAPGSEPSDDAALYPSFSEVVETYTKMRRENVERLMTMSDADLDARCTNTPKGMDDVMGTVGKAYVLLAVHASCHRGQLADARRVLGLKPIFG